MELEEQWEERSLNLLHDSKIDQQLSDSKYRRKSSKKHKLRWMKRPMAVPEVILELQDPELREMALRCLSNYLLEKREEEPENYYRTGYLLYNSCATVAILLQEIQEFFEYMKHGLLNVRSSKRVANVLTLFQSIAANPETRKKFAACNISKQYVVYENVRAVALSVIGILCQTREHEIIQWAIKSNMVQTCKISIDIGSELSKVIAMHILEAILQDPSGLSDVCDPIHNRRLIGLMKTFEQLVDHPSMYEDFSPRLLFHIIRCYVLLCNNARMYAFITVGFPRPFKDGSFRNIAEEFPVIRDLLHQLLLMVGKAY